MGAYRKSKSCKKKEANLVPVGRSFILYAQKRNARNFENNGNLPVIEIITENEFFDYEAKYQGLSREVCPAEIPDSLRDKIQEVSKKIYAHLGCSGLVRVDYICSGDDLYFLEVNTVPGMTSASLVPQMVRAAGLSMTDFLTKVIENS